MNRTRLSSAPIVHPFAPRTAPLRVAALFFLVIVAWVVLSDRAVDEAHLSARAASQVQLVKSGVFAVFASAAIYWLVRREIRQHLRSDNLLRVVAEETSDAIVVKDRSGTFVFVNEAAAHYAGRPEAKVLEDEDAITFEMHEDTVSFDDTPLPQKNLSDPVGEAGPLPAAVARTFRTRHAPYRDTFGNVQGVVSVARDITDRVRVEALQADREYTRGVLDAIAAHVAVVDRDGRTVVTNARWRAYAADHAADAAGAWVCGGDENYLVTCRQCGDAGNEDAAAVADGIRAVLAGKTERFSREYTLATARGRVWYLTDVTALRVPSAGAVISHTDVTLQKRADETRQERERLLQGVFARQSEYMAILDPDGRIKEMNAVPPQVRGHRREEYLGRVFWETPGWKSTNDWQRTWPTRLEEAAASQRSVRFEDVYPLPDGTVGYADLSVTAVRGGEGTLEYFIVQATDATAHKRSAESLRAAHQMLQIVFENIPQGIAWKDTGSRYLGCNRVVARAMGFDDPARLVGLTDADLAPLTPEQVESFVAKDREVMAADAPQYHLIESMTRFDGKVVWLDTTKVPMHDPRGVVVGLVVTWQDITEKKKLEEQLHQAQKMEAVGQLAGGVAHDFNNLLTVINGFTEILLDDAPATELLHDSLTAIRHAGERATGLTHQLLAFSRKAIVAPRVLDLNEVVTSSARLLRRLIHEDIALGTVLGPTVGRVLADPGQVEQVVMNLVVNARDAMPRGGTLTLDTTAVELAETLHDGHESIPPGRYVRLSVIDSGTGMTDDVRAKIFEPFFTTKEVGKGTGLGLATVYGIVKQAGGYVTVDSRVGEGTTFAVYLPAVEDTVDETEEAVPVAPEGTETILLAEDEDGVRALARIALEMQGYTVLAAETGAEAVALAASFDGPIHLLMTDVVMPDKGGRELADLVRARRPAVRVLFMSGYTDDAVTKYGVSDGVDAFLQKPFTPLSLARKVRGVLDAVVH